MPDLPLKSAACERVAVGAVLTSRGGEVGGRKCVMKGRMGECTKRSETVRYLYQRTCWRSDAKRRGGLRGGRLARSGNAKPERADAKPEPGALNPSGAGAPQVEARLPSDRLLS